VLSNDNQKEYSMLKIDIVQEDMFHWLMEVLDHPIVMVCVDIESIVEEIDQNNIVLAQDTNFVQYLSIRKKFQIEPII
jgi:hypothetical protein